MKREERKPTNREKLSIAIQKVISENDFALAEVVSTLEIVKSEYIMHSFLEHQASAAQTRIQNVTDPNMIKDIMEKGK